MRQSRVMFSLCLGLLLYPAMRLCSAATFSCGTGDVACLLAAIHAANSTPEPDTIRLAAGTYLLTTVDNTTNEANGLPSVTSSIRLQGVGAAQTVIVRVPSAPMFRLLHVAPTGVLTVEGLTVTGGRLGVFGIGGGILNEGTVVLTAARLEDNFADGGGGLANRGGQVAIEHSELVGNGTVHPGGGVYTVGGAVTIWQSTLAENGADGGGALANEGGTVVITNSTIVDNGNFVSGSGGLVNGLFGRGGVLQVTNTTIARNHVFNGLGSASGAMSVYGGSVSLTNCTVVDNTAPFGGSAGGIVQAGGVLVLENTLVARNTGSHGHDCAGVITSLGHNLIGDPTGCTIALQPSDLTGDPGLDAYVDDGQPGHGHYPLLATSRAVGAGNPFTCPTTDQLGRPRSAPCDLGAVEFQPLSPPSLAIRLNQSTFQPGQTLRVTLDLSNPSPILTTDVYVGVILPDGQTILWLTNTAPLEGVVTSFTQASDPRTFVRLLRIVSWPAGMRATQQDYFTHTFTGLEPSGTYHVLVGWTKPNSLEDGRIDEGDVLALAWAPFTFTPGSTQALYATMRAIQAKHGK